MNILILNYRDRLHPLAGGAEIHLHRIFSHIVSLGHTVHLYTTSFKDAEAEIEVDGIQVHREGADWNFNILCFKKLPELIKTWSIDVVVEDLNKLPVYAPWRSKVPVVVQMHHLWRKSIYEEASFAAASLVYWMENSIPWCYKKEHFIVVSPSTADELAELGIEKKRTSVIYNGLEEGFAPAEKAADENQAPYFLWLGRLRKYKGVQYAIEAFTEFVREYPEYQLHIAGSGPYRDEIEKWVDDHQLWDRVKLWGFVSEEEKLRLLQGAEAVLQTSHKEGWGLTVIEANACATPAIASRVPGLQDSVKHEETGLLFEAGSVVDLLECMLRLEREEGLKEKLRKQCLEHARSFDWKQSAQQTLELLEQVVAGVDGGSREG